MAIPSFFVTTIEPLPIIYIGVRGRVGLASIGLRCSTFLELPQCASDGRADELRSFPRPGRSYALKLLGRFIIEFNYELFHID